MSVEWGIPPQPRRKSWLPVDLGWYLKKKQKKQILTSAFELIFYRKERSLSAYTLSEWLTHFVFWYKWQKKLRIVTPNKKRLVPTSQNWAFRSESMKRFQLHFHRCDSCYIYICIYKDTCSREQLTQQLTVSAPHLLSSSWMWNLFP